MEGAARRSAIYKLETADFNDAVTQLDLQAGGLGIEDDLSHGARVYLTSASIA
jgi:hypothetical protein